MLILGVMPHAVAFAVTEDGYISFPLTISESDCNLQSMVGFGESVTGSWRCLSYTSNRDYYLLDINDVKNNLSLTWKNAWTDGTVSNTAVFGGIDYQMIVKSAANGSAGFRLGGKDSKTLDVENGYYTAVKLLASDFLGKGCYGGSAKKMAVILNYTDGTQELKETDIVGDPFIESENAIAFKTIKFNGSLWNNSKVTAANSNGDKTGYMHVVEAAVNTEKALDSVTLFGNNMTATDNSDGTVTLAQSDSANAYASANIFAVTAVTTKSAISERLKSQLNTLINVTYKEQNITENSDFYNAVKTISNQASEFGIDADNLFDAYTPTIKKSYIKGVYEEGEALTGVFEACDPFGRDISISGKTWYTSEIITDDKMNLTAVGTGDTYTLKKEDVGKYIYLSASPLCGGVSEINAIPTAGSEKMSNAFFKVVAPTCENVYFKAQREFESTYPTEEISVNYTYVDLNGDIEDGTVYTFSKSDTPNGSFSELCSTTENKYTVTAEDINMYIKCSVKVKNKAEKGEEAQEKVSENLLFVQDENTRYGIKLVGEYKSDGDILVLSDKDVPADCLDASRYEWYIADNFTPSLQSGWTKQGNASQLYKITNDIFGKYIAIVITPGYKDASGKITEEEKITKYFYKPEAPKAMKVKITSQNTDSKTVKSGDKLTGSYIYGDSNGDKESGTVIKWEKSLDEKVWTDLSSDTFEYTLTDDDADCYLRFSVTPKSEGEGKITGDTAYSQSFIGPFAPRVYNAKISGGLSVGSMLEAVYDFSDMNMNADIDSEITWYNVSSGGKTVLGTGKYYKLKSSDAGDKIMYEIIPKTNVAPMSGKTAYSEVVTVKKSGGGSAGGGSSFSGGGPQSYTGTPTQGEETKYEHKVPEPIFYDIENHWAHDTVLSMNEKGYMTGYDKKFRPDDTITRAELCAVVCRIYGFTGNYDGSFSDVSPDAWYAPYIGALKTHGVIFGENGMFKPDDEISREQVCKIFVEAYKIKTNVYNVATGDINDFADSAFISDWAKKYVENAYGMGLLKGDENKNFNPHGGLTRAETCVIIERILGL